MKVNTRLFTGALAAAAIAGGVALPALSASAATPACTNATGAYAGYCGSEVNPYGNAFDVKGQGAFTGNRIIAYPNSTTDPATDFIAEQTTSNPSERVFYYAPNGKITNLVITDPAGGYPGDSRDGLILKPVVGIHGSAYQQFTGVTPGNTAGTQWTNVATHQVVEPQGTAAQMLTVKVVTNRAGSYFGWDSPAVVPAG